MIRWWAVNDRWVFLVVAGVVFGLGVVESSPWEWLIWAAG